MPAEVLREPPAERNPGDDPSWVAAPVLDMSRNWGPIDAMVGGTDYLRRNASSLFHKIQKKTMVHIAVALLMLLFPLLPSGWQNKPLG